MNSFFSDKKPIIATFLTDYLFHKQQELQAISLFVTDSIQRLMPFVTSGKMLRGGLVLLSAEMFEVPTTEEALKLAAVSELFHATWLIHDDIIDRDALRRGQPTLHAQYTEYARFHHLSSAEHIGESLGICVGDANIFLAMELLASLPPAHLSAITSYMANEYTKVAFLEMEDISMGASTASFTDEQILHMYRYKTARYGFSLPLVLGAMLAQKSELIQQVEILGEKMGVIFQIQDDALGIFGTEKEIGKPLGSDLREQKKTLFFTSLMRHCTPQEQEHLLHFAQQERISPDDLEWVQKKLEQYHILSSIEKKVKELEQEVFSLISSLPVSREYKTVLSELTLFLSQRKV